MWYDTPNIPNDPEGEAATRRVAEASNIPYAVLGDLAIMEQALLKVPEAIATKHHILPLSVWDDGSLLIVADVPRDADELQQIVGFPVHSVFIAPRSHIDAAIRTYYSPDSIYGLDRFAFSPWQI